VSDLQVSADSLHGTHIVSTGQVDADSLHAGHIVSDAQVSADSVYSDHVVASGQVDSDSLHTHHFVSEGQASVDSAFSTDGFFSSVGDFLTTAGHVSADSAWLTHLRLNPDGDAHLSDVTLSGAFCVDYGANPTTSDTGCIYATTRGFEVYDATDATSKYLPNDDAWELIVLDPDATNDTVHLPPVDDSLSPDGVVIQSITIEHAMDTSAYEVWFAEYSPSAHVAWIDTVSIATTNRSATTYTFTDNEIAVDNHVAFYLPSTDVKQIAIKIVYYRKESGAGGG
jgi:hypothetical protein